MAWAWRPVMHSVHLFLLIGIISMVTCWWLWLHKTAYAVSPPSPILWLICVFYILFAIIIFPATSDTIQLLRIPKLVNSVTDRAVCLFIVSISVATLIAVVALEPPTASVSVTASLAVYAIFNFFHSAVLLSSFSVVPVVEIPPVDQKLVGYATFDLPVVAFLMTIFITVTGVRLAAASTTIVGSESNLDPFYVIAGAVLSSSSVIFHIFITGLLPLLQQQSSRTRLGEYVLL